MTPIRILITGPESSGKSELAKALAAHYQGIFIPEYARSYMEGLGKPYVYSDVEHIAQQQVREYEDTGRGQGFIFFDTWLIITRVWFEVVFESVPIWVDENIREARFDLVLVCAPDIPWVPDPLRENGGEKREQLFEKYKAELNRFGLDWRIVTGTGDKRIHNARQMIHKKLKHGTI